MPETTVDSSVDEEGRAIPLDPGEARRRAERGIRSFAAVAEIGDEEEQRATLEALLGALDEARPRAHERSA